ncbi:MAG: DUF1804 family protein [Methylophaga sp.]|nr:DUF1804 family protein [Methylophaga sp.]
MAHTNQTRNAVRSSFVYERLSLEAASEKQGVSFNTARVWKKKAKLEGDDWNKARSASRMAQGGLGDITTQLLEDFALLFQATITDIRDGEYDGLKKAEALSRLSDAYTKTMKAAAGGDPKIAKLSIALETLQLLAVYIKDEHPDVLERFTHILEPFGAKVNEAFG